MGDYAVDIVSSDYLYMKEISITEKSGEDQVDLSVKLSLDSSNFNFSFARTDGKDFRFAEKSNGSYVLNMFIVNWDATNKKATLYFKLPNLLANETKKLYAYWGNSSDGGISDGDSVDFLFFDHFDGGSLDTTKWLLNGSYIIGDSKIYPSGQNDYIQTKNNPLLGVYCWAFEAGVYITDAVPAASYHSYAHKFYGGDNIFGIFFYGEGPNDRYHNFLDSGSYVWDDGYQRGLEGSSYHEHLITYHEPTDVLAQGISKRATFADYLDTLERQCEGNTRVTYFRLYGKNAPGSHGYHDWILLRKCATNDPEFDMSNLYVQYEQVNTDAIVWDYGPDLTNINFEHTTNSGGDPYKLSDNSLSNVWCSVDDVAADSGGVDLIISFNTYGNELTDDEYLHYDSNHVVFYGASKLSDDDEDIYNRNYWYGTTTSGWACIDFETQINNVGILMIKGVSSKLNGMIKNYKFEGSYIYKHEWQDEDWKLLASGQFSQSSNWQSTCFENEVKYRFYRLKVIDTYGGSIALQEWKMYNFDESLGKKVISKLNLKPVSFDSQYIYFPKQIRFYGSNDLYNWATLINTKDTYTSMDSAWQEHAFSNIVSFYHYKLTCVGNWNNNTGKICIAEWEMREKNEEAHIYRILAGTDNNFNSIWAKPNCSFNSGDFYTINDKLSIVSNNKLSEYKSITGNVKDLNVF